MQEWTTTTTANTATTTTTTRTTTTTTATNYFANQTLMLPASSMHATPTEADRRKKH